MEITVSDGFLVENVKGFGDLETKPKMKLQDMEKLDGLAVLLSGFYSFCSSKNTFQLIILLPAYLISQLMGVLSRCPCVIVVTKYSIA